MIEVVEIAMDVMREHVDALDRIVACVVGDDSLEAYERALARH